MEEIIVSEKIPGTWLEWSVAARALAEQSESGDSHLVELFPCGALVAVVDGLGHGASAAATARAAIDALRGSAHESVITLIRRCHEQLKRTRGAVISLASFNRPDDTLTWLGVGNVRGVLLRADRQADPPREWLTLRGGIVGYNLPTPRAIVLSLSPGDTLVFATDGLHSDFAEGLAAGEPPQPLANRILAQSSRGTDDALVLVARYMGRGM